MYKKLLVVTGGLGFIGKNFCRETNIDADDKIIIDLFTSVSDVNFYRDFLKDLGWKLIKSDSAEISKLIDDSEYSHIDIFNFAAESHVDNSFHDVGLFLSRNVSSTVSVLDWVRGLKADARLFHISTDEVYGEIIDSAASEDHKFNPTNPYAASKASADLMVQTYGHSFNVPYAIVRANNVYGSRQYVEKLIPKAIFCASKGLPFDVHGSGLQRRHFLHTSDFTRALEVIEQKFDREMLSGRNIYNIAGDSELTVIDVVTRIYQMLDCSEQLISVGRQDRPFNDQRYFVDDSKLRSLGWRPLRDFNEVLTDLVHKKDYFA